MPARRHPHPHRSSRCSDALATGAGAWARHGHARLHWPRRSSSGCPLCLDGHPRTPSIRSRHGTQRGPWCWPLARNLRAETGDPARRRLAGLHQTGCLRRQPLRLRARPRSGTDGCLCLTRRRHPRRLPGAPSTAIVTHVSSITGVTYVDDPTILAWENCDACGAHASIQPLVSAWVGDTRVKPSRRLTNGISMKTAPSPASIDPASTAARPWPASLFAPPQRGHRWRHA